MLLRGWGNGRPPPSVTQAVADVISSTLSLSGRSWFLRSIEPQMVSGCGRAPRSQGRQAPNGLVTRATHPPPRNVYVRRRLAALGLEGLLLAVRTLSATRLRLRLSAPSLAPKSEEFLSLSLLDFSVAFPKLPEDEKTGRQNHLAENRISRILFHLLVQLESSLSTRLML